MGQMVRYTPSLGKAMLVLVACAALVQPAAAADVFYTGGSGGTANTWTTSTNWATTDTNGATNGVVPISSSVAVFGAASSNAGTSGSGVGLNFNNTTLGQGGVNSTIQAISVTSGRTSGLTLSRSDTTGAANATMTLTGATIAGVANTVIANYGGNNNLTFGGSGASSKLNIAFSAANSVIQAGANHVISFTANTTLGNTGKALTFYGNGSGLLDLGGTSSFDGGLTIGDSSGSQAGEVGIRAQTAMLTTGDITINKSSTLTFTISGGNWGGVNQKIILGNDGSASSDTIKIGGGTSTVTFAGQISGTALATLQKQGGGALTLTGATNAAWNTLIGNGSVTVWGGSALGTGSLTMAQSSNNNTALTLSNSSQQIGNLASSFTSTTSQTQLITLNGTQLNILQTGNTTYGITTATTGQTAAIDGTGSLVLMSGSTGTLTLNGSNTYSGGTTINGGSLVVANSSGSALGSGNVTVGSAGTLRSGSTGSLTGAVTVNGGTLSIGNGAVGTLTIAGGLALNANSVLGFNISGGTNSQIKLNASNVTLSGTTTVNVAGTGAANTTYSLMLYAAKSGSGNFALGTAPTDGLSYSLFTNGTTLDLQALAAGRELKWAPTGLNTDGSGTWANGSGLVFQDASNNLTTWSNAGPDSAIFGNGGAGGTVSLTTNVTAGALTFSASGSGYTINTNGNTLTVTTNVAADSSGTLVGNIVLANSEAWTAASGQTLSVAANIGESGGAKTLTVSGGGTVALVGTNTYSGGTVINGATLLVNSDSGLGTGGNVTFAGTAGTLRLGGDLTTARTVNLSTAGTIDTNGNNATLSSALSGAGALSKTGAGTLRLGAANSLASLSVSGGTLDIAGNNQAFTGSVTLVGGTITGTSGILTGASYALQSGTLAANLGSNAAVLTKSTAGLAYLTGSNSYSGGTSITGGTLVVGSNSNLGGSGAVTLSGGALQTSAAFTSARTVSVAVAGGTIDTSGGDLTLSGSIDGAGVLSKAGLGILAWTSGTDHTLASGIAVQAGTLLLAPSTAGWDLSFSSSIVNNGTIDVATDARLRGRDNTVNISGAGQLRFLANSSSLSIHSSQTMDVTNSIVLNPNNVGGTFVTAIGATSGSTMIIDGVISGTGSLMFGTDVGGGGAGLILLNTANSYTGATLFNNSSTGVVRLGINNALPTGTDVTMGYTTGNGGVFDLNGFNQTISSITNITNSGSITNRNIAGGTTTSVLTINGSSSTSFGLSINDTVGTGTLAGNVGVVEVVRAGTGTTTLSGTSNYSGATTISGGVLAIDGTLSGTSGVVVTGGSLAGSGTVSSAVNLAGGSINMAAGTVGAVSVTANSTWSGAATAASLAIDTSRTLTIGSGATATIGSAVTLGNSGSQLAVDGTLATSGVTVNAGATLAGIGIVSAPVALGGGTLRMTGGTVGAVSATDNSNWLGSATAASLHIDAGKTLTVGGGAVATVSSTINLDAAGSKLVSNGTVHATVNVTNGTLAGSGAVDAIVANGIVSPGNSPGTFNSGSTTWGASGTYVWQINELGASFGDQSKAGLDPGWDLWNTGDLQSIADGFKIEVNSLAGANSGPLAGWNPNDNYHWLIATSNTGGGAVFSGALTTLNSDLDYSPFAALNTLAGNFSLSVTGDNLYLDYTAVPEPGTLLLGALAASSLGWRLRRRRNSAKVAAEQA